MRWYRDRLCTCLVRHPLHSSHYWYVYPWKSTGHCAVRASASRDTVKLEMLTVSTLWAMFPLPSGADANATCPCARPDSSQPAWCHGFLLHSFQVAVEALVIFFFFWIFTAFFKLLLIRCFGIPFWCCFPYSSPFWFFFCLHYGLIRIYQILPYSETSDCKFYLIKVLIVYVKSVWWERQ